MASGPTVRNFAAGLVLAGLCLFAFGGTLKCGFVNFDDPGYVSENAQVSQGLTAGGIRWAFTTGQGANWHPLTWISHMVDVELYGLAPAGHHLTSLMFHALNSFLLFLVLCRLMGRFYPSLLVAALFAVHPLRVESVVWISERKDVLAMCFGLLALWAYVRSAIRGRMGWVALGFTLSLMSKPLWVTLPFLLLLLDYWPLRRWPGTSVRALIREKWLLFLLAAAFCLITYFAQHLGGTVQSFERYPLDVRLANVPVAYAQYIYALFWPIHLSFFYPHPGTGLSAGLVWGAFAALLLLTVLAVLAARRRPWWIVGWLWFLGALVPMIGLVQVGGQAWADRYTYLPHIGLWLALVFGAESISARGTRKALAVSAGLLIMGLALLSHQQTLVWRDSETLFRHALEVDADNAVAHNNLGYCLLKDGRRDEAIGHFDAALESKPGYVDALNNLSWVLATDPEATQEQAQKAQSLARRAIENADVPSASLLDTLAVARASAGDFKGAIEAGEAALSLAVEKGDLALADRIRGRLRLYREEKPFREKLRQACRVD